MRLQDLSDKDRTITAMIQACKSSVKRIEHAKVVTLLKTLKQKGIGTNEVEHGVNRTCALLSENARLKVKMKIMSRKIADAYKEYRRRTYECRIDWRECKKLIPNNLMQGYLDIWKDHVERYVQKVIQKHSQKVSWLETRWKKAPTSVPRVVRDIMVADDALPEEFTSNPRIYGGVRLDEDETEALKLSPKHGLYRAIDVQRAKIDVEESLNKFRWNVIFNSNVGGKRAGIAPRAQ